MTSSPKINKAYKTNLKNVPKGVQALLFGLLHGVILFTLLNSCLSNFNHYFFSFSWMDDGLVNWNLSSRVIINNYYLEMIVELKKGGDIILNFFGILISFITILLFSILCAKIIIAFIKKKPFPKKMLITTLSGGVLVSSIYLYETQFFTFSEIDREYTQDGPGPITSPTEKYTATAFYELYGGAVGGVNVWVEVTYNNDENIVKTVYYGDAKSQFSMEWMDEDTLYIYNDEPDFPNSDRSIELEIGKDIYHETGLACKSFLMKDEYENCYQN